MTQTSRFDALIDRVVVLYTNHQLPEALELLDAESTGLEPWAAELAHLKAVPARRLPENPDAALRTLQESSAAGGWWDPSILTDDDDLAASAGPA